jgi:methionyl-tRNA synthetase
MGEKKNFYVTTPIYYVTAAPHLGSLYSTMLADILARWHRLKGDSVFFATGTDEHGQKIVQAAHAVGKQPKEFVDQFIPAFQDAWHLFDIQYSKFVRTTDPTHIHGAQEFVKKIIAAGDTYNAVYEGWYCTPCETFIARPELSTDVEPACTSCGRKTAWLSEETVFFKLANYQERLLAFYKQHPDFITPKERFNEVITFVQDGLKDLSLSRSSVSWGVPFPGLPDHVIYVWVEALCNYVTAVGYGKEDAQAELHKWWPANVQVLGKDIVRFHAVYWPAMLMSVGLPLPKRLLVHGWIKVDKQKMSKSLGNVVDPVALAKEYGPDQIRYFLARQIPINQDGDFNSADLEQRITSDLANDLGNLLNRLVVFAHQAQLFDITAPAYWTKKSVQLRDHAWNTIQEVEAYMSDGMFHMALARLWKLVSATNLYFHECEPWKLIKTDRAQTAQVLSATAHALRIIGILLWPVMPRKMEELLERIGVRLAFSERNILDELAAEPWSQNFLFKLGAPLFEKIELHKNKQGITMDTVNAEKAVSSIEKPKIPTITIDDFVKVHLVVGTILECQPVPNSDKLLRLMIDLGALGIRQVLSGVAQHYVPADLIGKQGIVVTNLKPRTMAGLESHGMLLFAADERGKLQLMQPTDAVANGTQVK